MERKVWKLGMETDNFDNIAICIFSDSIKCQFNRIKNHLGGDLQELMGEIWTLRLDPEIVYEALS